MTITRADIMTIEVDCHAYAWHLEDDDMPECGPNNLIRMAEKYAVLIKFRDDNWGWNYEIKGPREHVIRLIACEYFGSEDLPSWEEAREYVG